MRATILCAALAVWVACKPIEKTPATPGSEPAPTAFGTPTTVAATKVVAVEGFLTPESVLHDTAQDIYFVSNINGSPTAKDNNGFISRLRPDGAVENLKFIEGGKNGVTLNAPKGLALLGDTLWVADIDAVRAFNAKTGAPLDSVSLSTLGAVFLNDIAATPTGALYITDTGIRFDDVGAVLHPGPDRLFRVGPDRQVTVAVRGDTLGRLDGVVIAGGKILVSSWSDSTVASYETGQEVKIITGVPSPADIGYDAKRNRVLIPVFTGNRVEVYQLP